MVGAPPPGANSARTPALLLAPVTLLLFVFFLAPLGIMALYSVLSPALYGGVEWEFYPFNYGRILGWPLGEWEDFDPVYLQIFARSARLALLTVLLTLILSYPAAFWVAGMPERRRNFVLFLITLPFFANLLIRIYAWMLILRPSGTLNQFMLWSGVVDRPLQMLFTEGAVVIGMVYVLLPFMFLPLYASVERLDRNLIQASADLGATPLQTFRRVIFPLTLPGVIGGSIIVFIPSLGNFVVPALLGGAKVIMVGNMVEQQFLSARNWPFGAALAMIIMATVLVVLFVYVMRAGRRAAPAPV